VDPKVKARVKPAIELMASLPSVVLGFLAALVLAPFVENIVPQVMAAFVTVPLSLLGGAYLWQLLPRKSTVRHAGLRLPLHFAALAGGLLLAAGTGPILERLLFAGDIKGWLDGQIGGAAGGWFFALLPLAGLGAFLLSVNVLNPWWRRMSAGWSRERLVLFDFAKFVALVLAAGLATLAGAHLLGGLGLDLRGGLVGTYIQRNALIVGFVMGFAVIPIIYTISEDALASVPDHLRSASLGAGATPWQTASRIILPTAASGVFSALMIGLGRAVGETMIVLMAAGNTPILDWNIFNGFRTLSANIAVELPEAVKNSTHYRTLFLAALTLFIMTFLINTAAEAVRLRFRKRAFEL